LKGQT